MWNQSLGKAIRTSTLHIMSTPEDMLNKQNQFNGMTPQEQQQMMGQMYGGLPPKQKTTALLLCLFLGGLGCHRFYVGKAGTGILQLMTLGGIGIWVLIDLILICCDNFKDSFGRKLAK